MASATVRIGSERVIVGESEDEDNQAGTSSTRTRQRTRPAAVQESASESTTSSDDESSESDATPRKLQKLSDYRIQIRSNKWWWALFANRKDVAMHNAWLLYRLSDSFVSRPLDLLEFRREVCQIYLQRFAKREPMGRPVLHGALDTLVHREVRLDGTNHFPQRHATQLRCAKCGLKVKTKCTKCDVGLHIDCFASYHMSK